MTDSERPKWMFQKNELDFLSSIFEFEEESSGVYGEAEKVALKEQSATEDRVEDELEMLLGEDWTVCSCENNSEEELMQKPIGELLQSPVSKDPLAQCAYRWTLFICKSITREKKSHDIYKHICRVRVNAPLVPAKIAFAAEEQKAHDPFALILAEKELSLGVTYLSRVLESLDELAEQEAFPQSVLLNLHRTGFKILSSAQNRLRYIRKQLRFRL